MSLTKTFVRANLFLALLMLQSQSLSQDLPIKWEEIPKADLEMKSYGRDTSAHALILADFGESNINDQLGVTYTRHMRIKIVSAAGYEWGNHVITLYTKKKREILDKLEGATYSLSLDGSIQKTELDDDMIFKEKADEDFTRYRFTLPGLQPGCVIEFRYRIRYSSPFLLPTWHFQSTIPTLWSEYRTLVPTTMAYAGVTITFEPFFISESQLRNVHIGGSNYLTGGTITECKASRWAMHDLAALHNEPYMTTMDDYTPQVRLQLAEYAAPVGITKVLKTWDKLIEELLDDNDFGDRLDPESDVQEVAQRIAGGLNSPIEKMTAIYDHIRSTMIWSGRRRVYAQDLGDALKARKGDGSEINFILMSMLRSVGLTVDPVIASTRSNGRVTDVYPLVEQFNTVVARVNAGGSVYFLDATDPIRPVDLVAPELLNVTGLVVKKGPVEWVKITSNRRYRHRSFANLELDPTGEVHGRLESADDDYSALLKRRNAREKKPLDLAKQIFGSEKLGLALDSTEVSGRDTASGPIRVTTHSTGTSYAQASGDYIYLNPVVLDRWTESPFKLKKRRFPVDMSYGRDVSSVTLIRIPAGFEIKEMPKDFQIGGEDIRFSRKTLVEGDRIKTDVSFSVLVSVFPAEVYESLCEFYNRMVAAEAEQIVLQRKPPATSASQTPMVQKKPGKKGTK